METAATTASDVGATATRSEPSPHAISLNGLIITRWKYQWTELFDSLLESEIIECHLMGRPVPDKFPWTYVPGLPHEFTLELFELSIAIDLIGKRTAARLGVNQTDLICLERLPDNDRP